MARKAGRAHEARNAVTLVATAISLVAVTPAGAVDLPRWEAGFGVGGLWLPDYRGSDESRGYILPIPYFIYRGDILKADREGVRAQFIDTDRVRFEVAVNASQPVRSNTNEARQGMPNLLGSFEVGPAVVVNLARSENREMKLDFRLPVSTGVTLGGGFKGIGWQTSPRLNLDVFDLAGVHGLNLGVATGPLFQSRKRDAYFYDVPAEFARPDRPAYRSSGGYAGSQALAALSKRFERVWVGGFVRYDTLNGASFEDSPLVRRKSYFAAGVGFAWVFGQSRDTVEVPVEDR
jgi:outer membrane protein